MGLVDYDSSGSDDESPAPPPPLRTTPATSKQTTKKPFQKLLDGGKIRVSLPSTAATAADTDDDTVQPPPAKRARVGTGSGLFSGLNSFLPAPKNRVAAQQTNARTAGVKSSSGNLKTGAAPAWSRAGDGAQDGNVDGGVNSAPGPEIPADMTPAEHVKLVGKPLMFKPLSVVRKQAKKTGGAAKSAEATKAVTPVTQPVAAVPAPVAVVQEAAAQENDGTAAPAPPKVSLFSFAATEEAAPVPPAEQYTPLFTPPPAPFYPDTATGPPSTEPHTTAATAPDNIASLADSMNLSSSARRALFGRSRDAASFASAKLVTFDMDREYAHNEQVRARGEEQAHNPLRAIQPGKHSLRQLIGQVQNQRDALEESFAAGKNKRKEAGGRYGW
ncbi:hypothetical protein TD95_002442 [Thielaviopsis punctulata]|uniref:Mitotic checkpoint regulator, MAD2B-interacting-domain-containing protein n=1 Tax=Thielaviopsis punctulata TaxID=72032 RepID=A0A0F4ZAK4_9PEZI|nr:hypothetical protein TD95_002442 [Thielaviopsis punctulata]